LAVFAKTAVFKGIFTMKAKIVHQGNTATITSVRVWAKAPGVWLFDIIAKEKYRGVYAGNDKLGIYLQFMAADGFPKPDMTIVCIEDPELVCAELFTTNDRYGIGVAAIEPLTTRETHTCRELFEDPQEESA
jgi:hypothetical protein